MKWVESTQVGDGVCDLDCMSAPCFYDSDQEPKTASDCFGACVVQGCGAVLLGNGKCDEACDFQMCGWDWGDCGFCAEQCTV